MIEIINFPKIFNATNDLQVFLNADRVKYFLSCVKCGRLKTQNYPILKTQVYV